MAYFEVLAEDEAGLEDAKGRVVLTLVEVEGSVGLDEVETTEDLNPEHVVGTTGFGEVAVDSTGFKVEVVGTADLEEEVAGSADLEEVVFLDIESSV